MTRRSLFGAFVVALEPGRAQRERSERGTSMDGEILWSDRIRIGGNASHCRRAGLDGIWEGIVPHEGG